MPKAFDWLRFARMLLGSLTVLCAIALADAARASELRLGAAEPGKLPAPIFSDHAVLQRDRPIPIFGQARPGARVHVELLDPESAQVLAAADADVDDGSDGAWIVHLPAQPAGGPFELQVSDSDGGSVLVRDVLVGEVWLASGQSNISAGRFPADPAWQSGFAHETGLAAPRVRAFANGDQRRGGGWAALPSDTAARLATGIAEALEELEGESIPVGVVNLAVAGSPIRRWMGEATSVEPLESGDHFRSWIAPLAPFAFRGVFWWQGESDHQGAGAALYGERLLDLVASWRHAFEDEELWFGTVLVPTGRGVVVDERIKAYPRKRIPEARSAGSMYNAYTDAARADARIGVALTKDLPGGLHPPDRTVFADRLVDLARYEVYGDDVVRSGPLLDCAAREGEEVRVRFAAGTSDGLRTGGLERDGRLAVDLRGFQIGADEARRVWADARIEGDTVVLSHPEVPNPGYVNYAWKANPRWANLFNAAGQAAGPFEAFPSASGCG